MFGLWTIYCIITICCFMLVFAIKWIFYAKIIDFFQFFLTQRFCKKLKY